MMVSDPQLSDYGIVIFDEFHERSLNADLGLALVRQLQQTHRPELKILLMSATLNKSALAEALNAKVIDSKGRTFPVAIHYVGESMQEFNAAPVIHQINEAIKKDEGDILVFLPGQGEIKEVFQSLKGRHKDIILQQLYGQLSWHKQQNAILPQVDGKRKVVLSTSIAETSLTIEGIKVVIDCGLGRHSEYDPSIGLSRLVTRPISKDEADQRTGRAGRTSPGKCYRLWSEAENQFRSPHRMPEILKNDLTPLRLDLYAKKIDKVHQLFWLSPPPIDKLLEAERLLDQLEAVEEEHITELGLKMQHLPCHPRLAHMLMHPLAQGLLSIATDLAALLEEKDTAYQLFGSDITARVNQLRIFRGEKRLSKSQKRINKIAINYRKLLQVEEENTMADDYEVGFLLALAYPDRIASARRGNNAQFQLANGAIAAIGHKDPLADEAWLAVAAMDARQGLGKIFLAAPLNPKDLSSLIKQVEAPVWNLDEDLFEYHEQLKIGQIILKSEYLDDVEEMEDKKEAIVKSLQVQGEEILSFEEDFEEFSRQINVLRKLHPNQAWPEMSKSFVLALSSLWIDQLTIPEEHVLDFMQELDTLEIAKGLLTQKQRDFIEQ